MLTLQACLTITGGLILVVLVLLETVSYLVPTTAYTVVMASASEQPIRLSFNITFPALPCHLLSIDLSDALGLHGVNVSDNNIHRFRIDSTDGRRLLGVADLPVQNLKYDDHPTAVVQEAADGSTEINSGTFDAFVEATDVALIAFGASWYATTRVSFNVVVVILVIVDLTD